MENIDRTNKCYRTKEDRLHSTIFYRGDLSSETPQERADRLKIINENRGVWVYDKNQGRVVRKEEDTDIAKEIEFPQISKWDPEVTVVATGKRMSKRELKAYCKSHNKVWENQ